MNRLIKIFVTYMVMYILGIALGIGGFLIGLIGAGAATWISNRWYKNRKQ